MIIHVVVWMIIYMGFNHNLGQNATQSLGEQTFRESFAQMLPVKRTGHMVITQQGCFSVIILLQFDDQWSPKFHRLFILCIGRILVFECL